MVYEAVYKRFKQISIVNYDVKRLSDPGAVGHLGAYSSEIVQDLQGQLSEAGIYEALRTLHSRKILREEQQRWRIAL
ncbi:hypothetical protein BEK98_23270 [Streptomyces diastatochromogenes]|uniref:Uncharacterized protein n=2 Tax=Streptomyces diastatochromogenes TaxID=42236 RepID=A0A233SBV2_STRDA|nr:hypothetical protein BEK98_23270 [Streptomyces diastatochromogenes]